VGDASASNTSLNLSAESGAGGSRTPTRGGDLTNLKPPQTSQLRLLESPTLEEMYQSTSIDYLHNVPQPVYTFQPVFLTSNDTQYPNQMS
jgi:hypothetical protein